MYDYLGMTLNYSQKGKIKFLMFDHIEGMLSVLPSKWPEGPDATPAAKRLFEVNDNDQKLIEE